MYEPSLSVTLVRPAGSCTVGVRLMAADGPLLVNTAVYVTGWPSIIEVGAVMVAAKSAVGSTVMRVEATLSASTGSRITWAASLVVELTKAVASRLSPTLAGTVSTMELVCEAALASELMAPNVTRPVTVL